MAKVEIKAPIIDEIKGYVDKASAAVLVDYRGLVISVITDALAEGDKVQLVGFGAFEVKARAERVGRNPKTKAEIKIPASKVPVFKAGKALKDAVAK